MQLCPCLFQGYDKPSSNAGKNEVTGEEPGHRHWKSHSEYKNLQPRPLSSSITAQSFPLILWLILHEKTRCIHRYNLILISLCWTRTKLEQFSYRSVYKVDKGHPAQHCCHSVGKHPQLSSSMVGLCLCLWQMGPCLQFCHQGVKVSPAPRDFLGLCFTSF